MRITHSDDPEAGTTTLTIEFPIDGDPDQVADLAWSALHRILDRRRRGLGTIPDGLREASPKVSP